MRIIISITLLQLTWLVSPAQERQWFSENDIQGLNFPGDARNNAVSFVVDDIAYVGTGENSDTTTTSFWKYAPVTKSWTRIADFIGSKRSGAVAFSLDGKGYVGTGKSGNTLFDDFYSYDPATDTWEQVASFGGGVRRNAIAFTANGKAYVGTGQTTSNLSSVSSDLWEYDSDLNTWTQRQDVPNPRSEAVAFSIGNKGYIACGDGASNNVRNLQEYDPISGSYRIASRFDAPYTRLDGVAFVLDGKGYIGLGIDYAGSNKKDFFIYDPSINTIIPPSQDTDQPEDDFGSPEENNRWGAVAFAIGQKAYVGLGTHSPNINDSETYVFKDDIWSFQYPTPAAPEALTVSATSLTEATLEWIDRSNNEQGFEVERSEGDNTSFSILVSLPADATTYQDNTLQSEKVYYYRVRATGQPDNHSSYTKLALVNTYSAPDELAGTMKSDTTVTLNWQDNSTIETGFVVERSSNGITYTVLDTLEADIITYVDARATAGIDYWYRVYALVNDIATDATSTIVEGILASPTNLRVASPGSTEVQLTWAYQGSNASHYEIERKSGDADFTQLISVATSGGKQYRDNSVKEAQLYTYRIKTTDATRASGYSLPVQTTTALHAPKTVTATVDSTGVVVRWVDISKHETHYVIRRSFADGSGVVVVDTLEANTISFSDTSSLDSGDYRYIVHAIGNGVESDSMESNTLTIVSKTEAVEEETKEEPSEEELTEEEEEETVTGIEDDAIANVVKVYPNPSNGLVSVEVGRERFAYVAVFNSQGRLVSEIQQAEQGSASVVKVDLQYFSAGIYTLRIYTARGLVVKKVAKQ